MSKWASALKIQPASSSLTEFVRPNITQAVVDWSRLVVLDFETYWDTEYTLKKLSTSEYVRDKRFKAHMVGVKVGNKKTIVAPFAKIGSFLKTINWKTHDLLCHNAAFDGFILSHHFGVVPRIYYDTLSMARGLHSNDIGASLDEVAVFYNVGNKIPDVLDQSLGVRDIKGQLFKDMAAYCAQDVELTLEIFKKMHAVFPVNEMKLVDLTIRMFCDPVLKVDIPRVEIELARELKEREDLLLSIDVTGFDDKKLKLAERSLPDHEKRLLKAKKIVGSNEQFADLLRGQGITPPQKISPAWIKKPKDQRCDDEKYAYAFAKDDQDFIELPGRVEEWTKDLNLNSKKDVAILAVRQKRIQELIDVRLAVKSTTNITRAQRFLTAGAGGLSLPVGYAYARAHTLRWGGNNKMNMQNLTRGGELRLSILAPKGYQVCVVDSGQIECRVNGWLWGQEDLMEAFRQSDRGIGLDAYCNFAALIYDRVITKADKTERFVGKVATLGLGFSMGPNKFQGTLAKGALGGPPVFFEIDQCQKIVNTYRRKNHRIVAGWKTCNRIIEDMAAGRQGSYKCLSWEKDCIWMPNGMALRYPGLKKSVNEDSGFEEWTYQAKNMRKKIYGGLLDENLVQCLARIIVAEQILMIAKTRRVVMVTHDEVVTIAPTRSADKAFTEMMKAMITPLPWCLDLPLAAEGGWDERYSK